MTETKIYIVEGWTGEYSDHQEWPVAAYESEDMAKAHAEAAKRWYLKNDCFNKRYSRNDEKVNPFDPDMCIDYTGTDWTVYEITLRDELPVDVSKP